MIKKFNITLKEIAEAVNEIIEENENLKQQLAESEKKLNQYPYKNDVIEKQYEDLKNGIKFRIENNITDDWKQLYHCIDVLCEKHKERIKDIENGICVIEKLEAKLAEKEKELTYMTKQAKKFNNEAQKYFEDACCNDNDNQDKISFCIEQLEKVKNNILSNITFGIESVGIMNSIDNQIKQLKEGKQNEY